VLVHGAQQVVNANPAGFTERQSNPLRFVPQNQAEELACFNGFFVGHI
jgi:hypothetical protein